MRKTFQPYQKAVNKEKIPLEYDEYYSQSMYLNRISDLAPEMTFMLKRMSKKRFILGVVLLFSLGVIGVAQIPVLFEEIDLVIGVGSFMLLFFFVTYEYSKRNIYTYTVSEKEIRINQFSFKWDLIQDIHLLKEIEPKAINYFLVFNYENVERKFPLNDLTVSESEIKQILYMYQRLWIRNTTTQADIFP